MNVTYFFIEIIMVISTLAICSELAELLVILLHNSWKIPKSVKLVETDFENCKLGSWGDIIHIRNTKYSYIGKTPIPLTIKYHLKTYNNETLIPIFRFTKKCKLIDSKFKELKNK